ncbi:MAG: DUF885 domain-containing protein [Chthoniobacterales bacterium]
MTSKASSENDVRKFYALSKRYLAQTYERYPQWASRLGIARFHHRLGNNAKATHEAQLRLIENTLDAVENLREDIFYGNDWINRRAFLAWLRTEVVREKKLHIRERNPQLHCEEATEAIFNLILRFSKNLRKGLPAIEARLQKLPLFLQNGLLQIQNPVPLWTKLSLQMTHGSIEFLNDIEAELLKISPHPTKTKKLFKDAKAAFARYERGVKKKKLGAADDYKTGRETLELLIRERLGLSLSIEEIEAIGRGQIAKIKRELQVEARRFGKKSAEEILKNARNQWRPSGDLRDLYEKITFEIRDHLSRLKIVSPARREHLTVLEVPAFLRSQFPTAAYSQPGAFDKKQEGIFWVNDLGKGKAPALALKERQQHFGLELTCVHEAYPGHHLQFVIQNQNPQPLRRFFEHAVFYEGWTLWCEKMAVEKKLIRNRYAKLQQLHDSLWRAYRVLIDCGLHTGKLSPAKAARLLMTGVGFTKSRAMAEIHWYSAAPTVPMSYLLGRIEVERLYRWFTKNRSRNLRDFNDWLLSYGAVPPAWIWESLRRETAES